MVHSRREKGRAQQGKLQHMANRVQDTGARYSTDEQGTGQVGKPRATGEQDTAQTSKIKHRQWKLEHRGACYSTEEQG